MAFSSAKKGEDDWLCLYLLLGTGVVSLQIRQTLDDLLTQMKSFPACLKGYQSFDFLRRMLKGYLKVNMTVTEKDQNSTSVHLMVIVYTQLSQFSSCITLPFLYY